MAQKITIAQINSFPYTVGGFRTGTQTSSDEILLAHDIPATVTFPANMSGSTIKTLGAATGSTALLLKKNGTTFCTATISAAGTSAAFSGMASPVSFSAGDELTVVGPGSADTTAAGFKFTLRGTL